VAHIGAGPAQLGQETLEAVDDGASPSDEPGGGTEVEVDTVGLAHGMGVEDGLGEVDRSGLGSEGATLRLADVVPLEQVTIQTGLDPTLAVRPRLPSHQRRPGGKVGWFGLFVAVA
jgi:hypothetical protein